MQLYELWTFKFWLPNIKACYNCELTPFDSEIKADVHKVVWTKSLPSTSKEYNESKKVSV